MKLIGSAVRTQAHSPRAEVERDEDASESYALGN